jgi:hypothetical protein
MADFDTAGKSKEEISYHIVKCKVDAEGMEKHKIEQLKMIEKIKKQIVKKRAALKASVSNYMQSVYNDTAAGNYRQFDFMAQVYIDMPRNNSIEIEWRILMEKEKEMQEIVEEMQSWIDSRLEISRSLTKLLIERGDLADGLNIEVKEVDSDDDDDEKPQPAAPSASAYGGRGASGYRCRGRGRGRCGGYQQQFHFEAAASSFGAAPAASTPSFGGTPFTFGA